MRIYQSADGSWILWDGATKKYFDTEQEAYMALSKDPWITAYRATVTAFINAMNDLKEHRAQWDALGYSGSLADSDFVGDNAGITAADMTGAVVSAEALAAEFATGHNTNFYRVKK